MRLMNDNELQDETVSWLQRVIRDDGVDYIMLAESLIKIIKAIISYAPDTKEFRVVFSDGYKHFEAYFALDDNGEPSSGVEITSI